MSIRYLSDEKKLAVGDVKAPFELKEGATLHLTVFLDKDMVEAFANDRQAVATGRKNAWRKTGIELFSEGGAIQAAVKGWRMQSIYASVKQVR
jgi:sucrose-6-phosphate hydrolase SacC (GH32 family)